MYALTRAMGRNLVRSFYRVEVLGSPLGEPGPLIIVGNHSNGLVDGGLALEATERPVRVLAKESLMRMPLFGWLLRSIGAIPLYRRKDGADTSRNDQAFEAIRAALTRGEPILAFPEGTSARSSDLGRMKTGAARMALGAEAEVGFELGVRILPIGLVYEDPDRFRSRAVVVIGEPFGVAARREAFERDAWAAVQDLTAEIERRIRGVAQTASTFDELWTRLDAESALEPDGRSRSARWSELAKGQELLAAEDPERAARVGRALADLRAAARSVGLCPSDVVPFTEGSAGAPSSWLRRGPLAAVGALLWSPPILIARAAAHFAPVPADKFATTLLLAAWLFVPLWGTALVAFGARRFGLLAGLALGGLAVLAGRLALVGWRTLWAPAARVAPRLRGPLAEARREARELVRAGSRTDS